MVDKAKCFSDLEEEGCWLDSILAGPMIGARLCMGKERYAEAEAKIRMGLELTTSHAAEAYTLMARANTGKGDQTQAMISLKKALELSQANKGSQPKLYWVLPENSVD